jgi:N6-adenosine-specific RNA methylase IME4
VIVRRRGRHSEKPAAVFDIIRRMYKDREYACLELFARRGRPGWAVWGNQAPTTALVSPRNGRPGIQKRIKEYLP